MTIKNRTPLALDYDVSDNVSGLAEFTISSVDLGDVATNHDPEQYQVLTWSAVGDGTFLYAPSTITAGAGGSVDLTAYATTAALATTNANLAATGAALALLTQDFYTTTGILTTTGEFYTATATLEGDKIEKPAGGAVGDLLLRGSSDNTANTTTPTDFISDNNIVKTSDLGAYVTEAEYDASAELFTTTGIFYTTTATLEGDKLEKPITGGGGDLLLYSSDNNTATTSVTDFITDQALVKTSDLDDYVTEAEFDGSAADFVTNAEYDTSASLFVATSITTANSRTFLGTNANLGNISDVVFEAGLSDGDTLEYDADDGQWRNNPASNQFLSFGSQLVTPNYTTASGSYIVSNVVTVPPGNTGRGDSTANSFIFFSGTDASSTEFVGDRFGRTWVTGPDQNIINGNFLVYFSSTDLASGTAAVPISDDALTLVQNISGAGMPYVIHSDGGDPIASSNSTALTEVTSITIPANTFATDQTVEVDLRGRIYGQGQNLRMTVDFGGSTALNSQISQGTASVFYAYEINLKITRMGTNKQFITANFVEGGGFNSGAGHGGWASLHREGFMYEETSATESGDIALDFNVQHSANSSGENFTLDSIVARVIPTAI